MYNVLVVQVSESKNTVKLIQTAHFSACAPSQGEGIS